jgi:hypothetical protein
MKSASLTASGLTKSLFVEIDVTISNNKTSVKRNEVSPGSSGRNFDCFYLPILKPHHIFDFLDFHSVMMILLASNSNTE